MVISSFLVPPPPGHSKQSYDRKVCYSPQLACHGVVTLNGRGWLRFSEHLLHARDAYVERACLRMNTVSNPPVEPLNSAASKAITPSFTF